MILEIIIIVLIVVGAALVANHFENKVNKEKSKISIKESMDLVKLPVVTFQEGNTKLNFLLDSGGSDSHISQNASTMLTKTPTDTDYIFTSSTGCGASGGIVETILKYRNEEFKVNLYVNSGLDTSFEEIKKDCGVQLHGILGSDFLRDHKYILDFAELVAYHK